MAKAYKHLTKSEQEELFFDLAKSLASMRTAQEVAKFIRDLLSERESIMLARRLQIARLLVHGQTYEEINQLTRAGFDTISRVQEWLNLYGDGYRTVIKRTKPRKSLPAPESLRYNLQALKRKMPMYFWPELVLDAIVEGAGKRERQKLKKVLSEVKNKSQLSPTLKKLIKSYDARERHKVRRGGRVG